ncbi:MAG: hypothetical protein GY861_27860, partial [bacterium]|nr:hypothetical protein [bacterium]
EWYADAHKVFWPYRPGAFISGPLANLHAILNRDTIRATLLHPSYPAGKELQSALRNNLLATGVLNPGDEEIGFFRKLMLIVDNVAPFTVPSLGDFRVKKADIALIKAVDAMFTGDGLLDTLSKYGINLKAGDDFNDLQFAMNSSNHYTPSVLSPVSSFIKRRTRLGKLFTASLFGDDRAADNLVRELAAGYEEFSDGFKKSLFKVVTGRRGKPKGLPEVYDTQGLHTAYYALWLEFESNYEKYPPFREDPVPDPQAPRAKQPKWRNTTYRDFSHLPTYKELFGDLWTAFAPSFDDLGIQCNADRQASFTTTNTNIGLLNQQ